MNKPPCLQCVVKILRRDMHTHVGQISQRVKRKYSKNTADGKRSRSICSQRYAHAKQENKLPFPYPVLPVLPPQPPLPLSSMLAGRCSWCHLLLSKGFHLNPPTATLRKGGSGGGLPKHFSSKAHFSVRDLARESRGKGQFS